MRMAFQDHIGDKVASSYPSVSSPSIKSGSFWVRVDRPDAVIKEPSCAVSVSIIPVTALHNVVKD